MSNPDGSNPDDWAHILVVFEPKSESVQTDVWTGLLGKGREIADQLGAYLWVYTEGEEDPEKRIAQGGDRVFHRKRSAPSLSERVEILGTLIQTHRPEILLGVDSNHSTALFGRVAQRFETGLLTDCVGIDLDLSERSLVAVKPLYGGKLLSDWVWPDRRPQMALIRPGLFPEPFEDPSREGVVEEI
jgi:electron transfer flavoprotein alpha subunit